MKYDPTKQYYLSIDKLSDAQIDLLIHSFRSHKLGQNHTQYIRRGFSYYIGINPVSGRDIVVYLSCVVGNRTEAIVSFGEFLDVLFDMISSKPLIKIGDHTVEFNKREQTIKVGCTTVDKETIKKILNELESK
jgi:hypothetical protein